MICAGCGEYISRYDRINKRHAACTTAPALSPKGGAGAGRSAALSDTACPACGVEAGACQIEVPVDWSKVMAISTVDRGVIEVHRARWDVWMTGKRRVSFGG